jgi:ribonuclease R
MFMVEANEAVASLLDRLNLPVMRRIHPDPDVLSLKNMARLLKAMGIAMPRTPDRRDMQAVLDHVKGTEQALAVNMVVLRSLERALYAPTNIGHYALASRHYCHFTSPIRRYADLLVHRQLQFHVEDRVAIAKQIAAGQDLFAVGKHITFTEERADDAEKELTEVLILQMLSKHIGDELACVVTGLTGFGVFAQSEKYGIDGLIKLEDLGPDHWHFNKIAQCIVGERSGETLHLGRPIRVYIASVDVPSRRLNVVPVEPLGGGKSEPRARTRKAERKVAREGKRGKGGRRSKRRT